MLGRSVAQLGPLVLFGALAALRPGEPVPAKNLREELPWPAPEAKQVRALIAELVKDLGKSKPPVGDAAERAKLVAGWMAEVAELLKDAKPDAEGEYPDLGAKGEKARALLARVLQRDPAHAAALEWSAKVGFAPELEVGDFLICRVGPWVVATDLPPARTPQLLHGTIARYSADISRQLFAKPRTEPVKVYLFKDKTSYEHWAEELYKEKPHTPFGYYSREHKAMVMNIGTGGGTLLHEMVHAMSEVDYPDIPAWLNEGLGSLFEASGRGAGGKVVGLVNWRLPGLQEALAKGKAPKLAKLLALSDEEFYGPGSGEHYAAARYLMQYLQEQGQLENFYRRVRDRKEADAAASLRQALGGKQTLEETERAFYEWVKELKWER